MKYMSSGSAQNPCSRLITRRALCMSLAASAARGQTSRPTIPVRTLNHMTLIVGDLKRSLDFYQGLLGMPVQARQGNTVVLRIGSGPQFVALAAGGAKPGIGHFCMTTDPFDVKQILATLAAHGVSASEPRAPRGATGDGAMKVRVRVRGEKDGGAKEGTPEIYVGDPDGIVVQLQHPAYCGGAGILGDGCPASVEPLPRRGLLAVRDLNHFTLYVSNEQRSRAFYRGLFGLPVQVHQGETPLYRVGSDRQVLAMTQNSRVNGATPGTPGIAHVCFSMEGFHPDRVLKTLAEYGVKQRSASAQAGPLTSYVVMRMEDRGGAKGGTPELYVTDPDGITLQLQDVSYCGGSGYLGEVCS